MVTMWDTPARRRIAVAMVVLGLLGLAIGIYRMGGEGPQIVLQGLRAQSEAFGVPQADLQTPQGITTLGVKAADPTGSREPFFNTSAYRFLSSPKPGTAPYAARGKSHSGFRSLSGIPSSAIALDFQGAELVDNPEVIQNITGEGKIAFSDPRLQRTDNLVYFRSQRTAPNPGGNRSEKRTYVGGSFTLWDTSTNAPLAEGTIDFINVILDYDSFANFAWAEFTVTGPAGSAFYEELQNVLQTSRLSVKATVVQTPISEDSPPDTPLSERYAVFDVELTVTPGGGGAP